MPRLIYIPSRNSWAIRFAIPNLSNAIEESFLFIDLFGVGESYGLSFDPPLIISTLKNAMDINTGDMDLIGIQFSGLNQLLYFCNSNSPGLRHGSRKITGRFSENKV